MSDPDESDSPDEDDIDAVFDELEELAELVDTDAERRQVRETMRTLQRARRPGLVGRFRSGFGARDAGEAVVGSFVFGTPMIAEDGTFEMGRFIAARPALAVVTLGLGAALVYGILHAGRFERVAEDLLLGVVPVRLLGLVAISGLMAAGLVTLWGRVDWATPWVAACQTLVVGVVMGVGATLGDIIPEP
jgi:uncharacterized membrane protein